MTDHNRGDVTDDKRVQFCWTPSFQQMAATNLAILVWQQAKIFPENFPDYVWSRIEKAVSDKISQLCLPELLQEEVMYVYQPVGRQIRLWLEMISLMFKGNLPPFSSWQISWTARGMIDERASAEWILENLQLDLICQYRLACMYGCESHIVMLFPQMNRMQRTEILNVIDKNRGSLPLLDTCDISAPFPEDFLARMAFIKFHTVHTVQELSIQANAFRGALLSGSRTAAILFYSMLSSTEEAETLKWAMEAWESTSLNKVVFDFLIYILSIVDAEMQQKLLTLHSCSAVKSMSFDWQWRHMYGMIVNYLQDLLSGESFLYLLAQPWLVLGTNDVADAGYQLVVREMWKRSSTYSKKYVLTRGWNLFARLLELQDATSLNLMWSVATDEEREKFATSKVTTKACISLAEMGRVELIDILFRAICSSATDVETYKERLIQDWSVDDLKCTLHIAETVGVIAADLYLDWRFSSEEKALFLKLMLQKDEGVRMFMTILTDHRFGDVCEMRERWLLTQEDFCIFQNAALLLSKGCRGGNEHVLPAILCLTILKDKKHGNFGCPNFKDIVSNFFDCESETDMKKILVERDFATHVCSNLIECGELQLALSFLFWLFPSEANRSKFLAKFFVSSEMMRRCSRFFRVLSKQMPWQTFHPWLLLKKFLPWFRPTPEMITIYEIILGGEFGYFFAKACSIQHLTTFIEPLDDPDYLSIGVTDDDAVESECEDLADFGLYSDVLAPFLHLFSLYQPTVTPLRHQRLDLTFSDSDADELSSIPFYDSATLHPLGSTTFTKFSIF